MRCSTLLRLRNGYIVANMKVFCIGANLATLILEIVRLRMFGFFGFGTALALFILAETVFSLSETMTAKVLAD